MSNKKFENIDIEIIYSPNKIKGEEKMLLIFFGKPFIQKKKKEKLRIFGEIFVKNNKDKCKIIYKEKEFEMQEYFEDIDNNYNNYKNEIILKLRIYNNITDLSHMFDGCKSLFSINDIPQMKSNITEYENNLHSEVELTSNLKYESEENISNIDNKNNLSTIFDELNQNSTEFFSLNFIANKNTTISTYLSDTFPKKIYYHLWLI